MSDRTMISVAGNRLSVPKVLKRILQVFTVTGLTALVSLVIVMGNALLMGKAGYVKGLDVWLGFIQRPDIAGTIVLTAIVAVAYAQWNRSQGGGR